MTGLLDGKTLVRIEGRYTNGHRYERRVWVDDPETTDSEGLRKWWQEVVWNESGDGQPGDAGSWTGAYVIATDVPELVDGTEEWTD